MKKTREKIKIRKGKHRWMKKRNVIKKGNVGKEGNKKQGNQDKHGTKRGKYRGNRGEQRRQGIYKIRKK